MNRKSRSGYSLVELTAVLGICSVLAGISVWLVHMSMQKTRDGRRHLASQKAVSRAVETFRRDVHAAVSIAKVPVEKNSESQNKTFWYLNLDSGNSVRYQLEPGRLVRDEYQFTSFGSSFTITVAAHETFDLPPAAELSISLEPPSAPRMASLLITDPAVRIDAAMSIDHRFKRIKTVNVKTPATSEEVEK